jgi:hypothetical protein
MEMPGCIGWERTLVTVLVLALAALAGLGAGPASARWLAPADLAPSNPAGTPTGDPSIAMARDGTAVVVFSHFDGANTRVAAALRTPGGGFAAVRDLSVAGQNAFGAVVAVDRQGNMTLAFAQGPSFHGRDAHAPGRRRLGADHAGALRRVDRARSGDRRR